MGTGGMWVLLRWKVRDGYRLIGQGHPLGSPLDEAMSQPLLIVAFGKVRAVMSPAAFLPGEGAGDDGFRDVEKTLEFEGLYELRVKYLPFVLHRDRGGAMAECREC